MDKVGGREREKHFLFSMQEMGVKTPALNFKSQNMVRN
jgi:hypothetical protein